MPAFNLNKLRSYGLRYIVADKSGQLWAYERPPVRSKQFDGHWVLCEEQQPPKSPFEADYQKFYSLTKEQREEAYQEYRKRSNAYYAYRQRIDRRISMPLLDCPYSISWEDEPFDLVERGIVANEDMKHWGDFPKF